MKLSWSDLFLTSLFVVGVLYWGVLPRLASSSRSPLISTRLSLNQVVGASYAYKVEYGFWPTGMVNLLKVGNSNKIVFLYPQATNDGWNHPLKYNPFNASLGYGSVLSFGRDGKVGGVGIDADCEVKFGTNE